MEKQEWLSSLKVGDRVAVSRTLIGYRLHTIQKITPTRRITLDGGIQFDKNGNQMDAGRWNIASLEQPTDEVLQAIRHQNLVSRCQTLVSDLTINQLSTEALEEINEVLSKHLK